MTKTTFALLACLAACATALGQPIPAPGAGRFYHGCYPGGITGEEDDITVRDVQNYEKVVGQNVAWVYFSNNWYASRRFPVETATWIRKHGAVPYIRLMLRSRNHAMGKPEKGFALQSIIDGKFDSDLKAWGRAAGAFASPLIVEYGTEANGEWFGWNGKFHGENKKDGFGDPFKADGPERFVAAYRHIVDTVRGAGADNIAWVFHLDASQSPEAAWNRFENYYPGSDYVQWIGVSCYGPQKPTDDAGSGQRRAGTSFSELPETTRRGTDPIRTMTHTKGNSCCAGNLSPAHVGGRRSQRPRQDRGGARSPARARRSRKRY